ncbi:MAG: hypothetical protein K8S97_15900, partial [Anaerolineae bacterium]|nr:hypothetical protein [Anaerolineae bacterium]
MGTISIVIMLAGGIIILGGLIIVGMREDTGRDPLESRLAEYAARDDMPQTLEEVELSLSTQDRIIIPMYRALARMAESFTPENQIDNIRRQIELAGKSQTMEPLAFFGQRIAL